MTTSYLPSPTALNYLGALRGLKPRAAGAAFRYADLTCDAPEQLACLAASNPEGQFFGIVTDDVARARAEKIAKERGVTNLAFKTFDLADLPQLAATLGRLDYIHADSTAETAGKDSMRKFSAIAGDCLAPGGIFNLRYQAYSDAHGALKFLVREFAPEMTAEQSLGFLHELKQLGGAYLAQYPEIAAELDRAIAAKMPDEFFSRFDDGAAASASFDTLLALRPQGLAYVGDADISKNYIELSLQPAAQAIIERCSRHALYEPLKDYALARQLRSDVWCRPVAGAPPATMAELFGGFVYGVTLPSDKIPSVLQLPGTAISLATPLYQNLIKLLSIVPAGIGDFLAHPLGQGYQPTEVIGALQIMIACGLAQPMRGGMIIGNLSSIAKPKLVGDFNRFLEKTSVTGETWLASPVVGCGIAVTPRDALVLQALDRAGLADSVSALFPELEKLAKNPAIASRIMDTTQPTPEMAHHMIEDAVSRSILHWYAYGVLAAA